MRRKIGVLSLGCARNLVDSEILTGILKSRGCQIVDLSSVDNNIQDIDVVLVNTCAFIKEAKEESIDTILDLVELKREGAIKSIVVAGCLSQRYKDKLVKHLPEIDAFLGVLSLNHTQERFRLTPAYYAYVKICEGCINHCSFCVIPYLKPKFTSRAVESIITEIKALDNQACREVNIIGQDITAYGWDLYQEFSLTRLIKSVLEDTKKIDWLRLLYLSPGRITDELLSLVAGHPRIVKYIDMPLQHINDRILKMMNRNISSLQIYKLIENIRKKVPDAAIRTSLMVGFPAETEKEFKEVINFIKDVKFERLGLFMYSREEGTPAYSFNKQVSRKVKEERYNIVMSLQRDIARVINEKWRGRVLRVLIEGKDENNLYVGRSQYDAPEVDGVVFVKTVVDLSIGCMVDVKITDTLDYDLVGEVFEGKYNESC